MAVLLTKERVHQQGFSIGIWSLGDIFHKGKFVGRSDLEDELTEVSFK